MKLAKTSLTVLTALAISSTFIAAQESPSPPPSPEPRIDAPIPAPPPVMPPAKPPATPGKPPGVSASNVEVQTAKVVSANAPVPLLHNAPEAGPATVETFETEINTQDDSVYDTRVGRYITTSHSGPGPQPARTLVVHSAHIEPKELAAIEEDMAIMSRILEKAAEQRPGVDPLRALNITLYSVGAPRNFRSLYLDGYGAIFFLNVRFPLLPPPAAPVEAKGKAPGNSSWEQAKRELYGPRRSWEPLSIQPKSGPREEYDERKVEKLKNNLIEALKNAANIRHLQSADSIVMAVIGGQQGEAATTAKGIVNKKEKEVIMATTPYEWRILQPESQAAETVLTIRVKKADVDAFAKGELSLDDFRKKAAVLVY